MISEAIEQSYLMTPVVQAIVGSIGEPLPSRGFDISKIARMFDMFKNSDISAK